MHLPLAINQEKVLLAEEWCSQIGATYSPFHVAFGISVKGVVDVVAIEASLHQLIVRHSALRAKIEPTPGIPRFERISRLQIFAKSGLFMPGLYMQTMTDVDCLPIEVVRLDRADFSEIATLKTRLISEHARRAFDYLRPPLVRALVIIESQTACLVVIVAHHLVMDLWSQRIFEFEFVAIYNAAIGQGVTPWRGMPFQYPEFVSWQRQHLQTSQAARSLRYWTERWRTLESALVRRADLPFVEEQQRHDFDGVGVEVITVAQEAREATRNTCADLHLTPYMVWLGAFLLALSQLTGKRTVAVWIHLANRVIPESTQAIGWFANAHILGVTMTPETTVRSFLHEVRTLILDANVHQATPISVIRRITGARLPSSDLMVSFDGSGPASDTHTKTSTVVNRVPLPRHSGELQWMRGLHMVLDSDVVTPRLVALFAQDRLPRVGVRAILDCVKDIAIRFYGHYNEPIFTITSTLATLDVAMDQR